MGDWGQGWWVSDCIDVVGDKVQVVVGWLESRGGEVVGVLG